PGISTHGVMNGGTLLVGDNISTLALAKILSLKYNLDFYYTSFRHSDLFVLDKVEKKIEYSNFKLDKAIHVTCDSDIQKHLGKSENLLFFTGIGTKIDGIKPEWVQALKAIVQLKEVPKAAISLPKNIITVALHIRKGNGGGEYYDGEQSSLQYFTQKVVPVVYLTHVSGYPFEWDAYKRKKPVIIDNWFSWAYESNIKRNKPPDTIGDYYTKFPPDQFYVDQVIKLSKELNDIPLHVQLFTADKQPLELLQKIKQAVNKPNIVFQYAGGDEALTFRDKIARDLHGIAQADVLIRSQSYFSRAAEIMGDHKLVMYPLEAQWHGPMLIMRKIVIKGSFDNLRKFAGEKAKLRH
ncbi:MAG TPA: hypothetical protein VJJ81_02880, partial [Candidatus Babeliales bacterium]|nr:hypothetical protein [Candidatus Babeliales bacterium]